MPAMIDRRPALPARSAPLALLAAAACACALVAGCGAPARPLESSLTDMDSLQLRSWISPQLRRNIDLLPVTGGQETSRWWGTRFNAMSLNQAYQESLRRLGLMPDVPETGRFQLKVEVLALAQPNVPMGPEVAIAVRYTLSERAAGGGNVLYQRVLRTTQKAGIDDSLNPTEQLRIATEAALRNNIAELIRELASLPLPG
ncbi:hypothetical protein CDN99_22350 [Roseateles aquatilis]|uniref:ABC-type transport auxiliary lipoprotein component domain-containing protein n=2 Tax=Roseateles aquatilis TaxID=431061 RepID=A0A2D0AM35_9BURK|nr:hypothetical protein CDN99_22350 [Roseateles aquatilis]